MYVCVFAAYDIQIFIGVGDERSDKVLRPRLLDQSGGRMLLCSQILIVLWLYVCM
jgi:hypothetical protein